VIFAGLGFAQLAAIFGIVGAAVVGLYVLRLRRRTVAIPFSPLWQKILKDKGITTIVPVGTTPHNGVLFTSVAAAFRGFNPVVPVDGMSGNNAYEDQAAAYILANSIVYKVTLTSIDMIKFQ